SSRGGGGIAAATPWGTPPVCSVTVILQWNNPFGASADDFDLFLARSDNFALLASSTDVQDGTQDPYERVDFTNVSASPITAFIAISEFNLTSPPGSIIRAYLVFQDWSLPPQHVT